jgi:hypothetical protein
VTALPVVRRPEADCPFCGKAEGDNCPACHGVEGAAQKRRARVESERAGDGRNAPSLTVTETTATGKPAPRGDDL